MPAIGNPTGRCSIFLFNSLLHNRISSGVIFCPTEFVKNSDTATAWPEPHAGKTKGGGRPHHKKRLAINPCRIRNLGFAFRFQMKRDLAWIAVVSR
jgi:hypothetical protein